MPRCGPYCLQPSFHCSCSCQTVPAIVTRVYIRGYTLAVAHVLLVAAALAAVILLLLLQRTAAGNAEEALSSHQPISLPTDAASHALSASTCFP